MSIHATRLATRALVALAALAAAVALLATSAAPASANRTCHPVSQAAEMCDQADRYGARFIGIGSILDGWGNRDMDIGAFSVGSRLDGWANRDLDIGGFGN